jgi:multidrug efflux pump subunit AcrB
MMMVKMEQGLGRVKAATFAWESTAFPMLTGTLITAAGFMPVGFAASSTGEYTGSMFWVLVIALIASWFVAVIFTPYLGVKLLPDFGRLHPHHDPDEIYRTRGYILLRRVITWSVDHRGRVVAATALVFVLAALGFAHVQKQFFPLSERPELFFQLPAGRLLHRCVAGGGETGRGAAERRQRCGLLHQLCRSGAAAILAWTQPRPPQ